MSGVILCEDKERALELIVLGGLDSDRVVSMARESKSVSACA